MGSDKIFREYFGKCDWNIGALFAHDGYVFHLYETCKELNIEFPIKYVFGSIPCLLQGGRVSPRTAELQDAFEIMEKYQGMGIGCRLTFSSTLITEKDLDDKVSNALLGKLNEGRENGVIISSDLLAVYVKEKYKNLCIISSQVKPSTEVGLGNDTVEYYNNLFNMYDLVVVNPVKCRDEEFLRKLEYKDRVEFITNHRCRPNCTLAKKHYELQMEFEREDMAGRNTRRIKEALENLLSTCSCYRMEKPLENSILSNSEIERLCDIGFKHFKLEGRDNNGISFMRDVGQWIFNPDGPYLSITQSFQGGPI